MGFFKWLFKKMEDSPYPVSVLSDHPIDFEDMDGTPVVFDKKPPRRIDMDLFTKVKRAIVLKNGRKFYKTERDIAKRFKISTTTVMLIRRARSLKHYRDLRRKMSKPNQYED